MLRICIHTTAFGAKPEKVILRIRLYVCFSLLHLSGSGEISASASLSAESILRTFRVSSNDLFERLCMESMNYRQIEIK